MGVPFPMQETYLGFMRDAPRHQLPGGMCWDMIDWIPQLDGAARWRGAWQNVDSRQFATIHGGANNVGVQIAYGPYTTGAILVMVSSDGSVFYAGSNPIPGSGVGYVGAGLASKARPIFHRNRLITVDQGAEICTYTSLGGAPTIVNGTGTPHALCGTIYLDYTVLCNVSGNPQRAFFSNAGDPMTYDMTNSWVDIPGEVRGVQGIRNALLFWTRSQIWRVRGDTPPSLNIVGNLSRDHLYDTGLLDERSIAVYGEQVLFANAEGVWLTNGASVQNLCELGGIATYWRSLLSNYVSSWVIAGGIYKGDYIVSITNGSTVIDTLAYDLTQRRWKRFSNLHASMFAHGTAGTERLFWVSGAHGYVAEGASMFAGTTPSAADGNGVLTMPSLETPVFRGFQRLHRRWIPTDATSVWQRLYLNYEAPGAGSALRVDYTTDPELGGAYATVGDISAGAGLQRRRLPINPNGGAIPARAIGFKIYRAPGMNPTDCRLNDLELEFFTREGNR